TVLTIAGSDSGGGAGIQADLKTFSACGCYGMSVITAITAQNTQGVSDIFPVQLSTIEKQIDAVMQDIGAKAVKVGMLHSSAVIELVAGKMQQYEIKNLVVDPVMVATSGDKLLQDEAMQALHELLLPMARVITPNIPEAEILLGKKITSQSEFPEAAVALSFNNSVSVLLKAGHLSDEKLIDVFYNAEKKEHTFLESQQVSTLNTHGTGCTLSSAVASFLALDEPLEQAVRKGKDYISHAIEAGKDYKLGHGHGPVHHFYKLHENL
ncbi:MAG TPA: bifunctional hydroxymethylpyrimidine kinase/phosphomethylpyrimidine kinase, partial [Bacteroidales bacterium]|nr:bifunctional hydroxymethylpyrimidine kinase/phosphomethylpyrimidine kinase [Bacteroidales bacterium]